MLKSLATWDFHSSSDIKFSIKNFSYSEDGAEISLVFLSSSLESLSLSLYKEETEG